MDPMAAARLVMGPGAWWSLRGHVRRWERFEEALAPQTVYPPGDMEVLAYFSRLAESGCGPCVLPSMRGTVTWIWQVVREAPPIPMGIMRCLETAFFQWTNDDNDPLVIFCWMVLIMTWGSMRYDDAAHIDPKSIQQTEFGVKFVAWQTKVDRKRRGTSFVVPDVAFGDRSWLVEGLTWLRRVALASFWDRDYMLIETDLSSLNWDRPLLYHDFVAGPVVVPRSLWERAQRPSMTWAEQQEPSRRIRRASPCWMPWRTPGPANCLCSYKAIGVTRACH